MVSQQLIPNYTVTVLVSNGGCSGFQSTNKQKQDIPYFPVARTGLEKLKMSTMCGSFHCNQIIWFCWHVEAKWFCFRADWPYMDRCHLITRVSTQNRQCEQGFYSKQNFSGIKRNNSYYFSRANQQTVGTKIYSLTQCSLTVNECDWYILVAHDERINSHCLTWVP